MLYLHSSQGTNNRYTLDNAIEGVYKLISFSCTNNIYNVDDTCNKIYFNENGINYETTLENGYYNYNDFVTECLRAISDVSLGSLTATRDSNTNKLRIINSLSFYFTFGSNTENSARKLMGFNEVDGTNSTLQVSDNPMDLNTHKSFFINISDNDNKNIEGIDFYRTSFIIQGEGGFGEILRYKINENIEQYIKFSRGVKNIDIKFHDLNQEVLDINSEYEIILKKV